jgi:hypothetical protein
MGMAGAQAAAADLARARGDQAGPTADPVALEAACEIFTIAEKYLRARRTYPDGYPALVQFQKAFGDRLLPWIAERGELRVGLQANGLTWSRASVFAVDNVDANMWFPLYRDGIRELTFSDGVQDAEIAAFFKVLAELATRRADKKRDSAEDDAVTMMWDLHLDHIGYVAIDSFVEGSDADEVDKARMERLREMLELSMEKDYARTKHADAARRMTTIALSAADLTFLESENLGALDELPAHMREAGGDLHRLEPAELVTIRAQLADDADLVERFLDALLRALMSRSGADEAEALCGRLEQFFVAMIEDGNYVRASELRRTVEGLVAESRAEDVEFELIERIDNATSSDRALDAVVAAFASQTEDAVIAALDTLVRSLPFRAAGKLVADLDRVTDAERRRRLGTAIAALGPRAVEAIAAALPASAGERAADLLAILRQTRCEAALPVLEKACRHPDAGARAEALRGTLELAPAAVVARSVKRALLDKDPQVRRVGLDFVVAERPPAALDWLRELLYAPLFVDAELRERTRVYQVYALVGGDPVAAELVKRLEQKNLLGRPSLNEERAAAAAALGYVRCQSAREVLRGVARSMFTNALVKEACLDALAELDKATPHEVARRPCPSSAAPANALAKGTQPAQAQLGKGTVPSEAQPAPVLEPPPAPAPRAPAQTPVPTPAARAVDGPGVHIETSHQIERVSVQRAAVPPAPRDAPVGDAIDDLLAGYLADDKPHGHG